MSIRRLAVIWLVLAIAIMGTWTSALGATGDSDFALRVIPEPLEWLDDWEGLLAGVAFIGEYRLETEPAGGAGELNYGFHIGRFPATGERSIELYTGHFGSSPADDDGIRRFRLVISVAEGTMEATVRGKFSSARSSYGFGTMPQPFTARLDRVVKGQLKSPLSIRYIGEHYAVAYWAEPNSIVFGGTPINLANGYTPEELVEALRTQGYGTIHVLSIAPHTNQFGNR